MLSVRSAFDSENALFSSGKSGAISKQTAGENKKALPTGRKVLGDVTNTPVRRPLSNITNKQANGSTQKSVKKADAVGVKVKKVKEAPKVNKVMDVEHMHSFKHNPLPDLPVFDVNQFLNITYSEYADYSDYAGYASYADHAAPVSLPAELLYAYPVDDEYQTELAITIDDCGLTDNLLIH